MFSFTEICNKKMHALVMGILNVTPDSFSDGGENFYAEKAFSRALAIESEGADVLDIGACSTAPTSAPASYEEELARLKTVLPLIPGTVNIPVSVDTFRPGIAEFAVNNGAVIINDESGTFNEAMAKIVKDSGAGWVFMHTGGCNSRETSDYKNGVVSDVLSFFTEMREKALSFGLKEEQLAYDYGCGFGKTRADDLALLRETAAFSDFKPLLVGVSRKRVIGEATGITNAKERVYGSVSAAGIASFLGAGILRVHDVKATADAVRVAAAIEKGEFCG